MHTIIQEKLLRWYDREQRSFAFRGTKDPYRIWLSEIMLQQTRTETMEAYYLRFLRRFPTLDQLADAREEDVLKAWEGLGYYSRARNLLKAAKLVYDELDGQFPRTAEELHKLPGVGPYTAAAIASIAFDEPVPALDGNLNRVISRLYLVEEDITKPAIKRRLKEIGTRLMPDTRAGDMNQALMDLGAGICLPGAPDCGRCPLSGECLARLQGEPERLPIMPQKRPPKLQPLCVCLLFRDGKVFVQQRQERLLKGLYVFHLFEGKEPGGAEKALKLQPGSMQKLGEARHIFTHLIWEMGIHAADILPHQAPAGGQFVDLAALEALPMPTAMQKARALCVERMRRQEAGDAQG